jgi:hypothetical protein
MVTSGAEAADSAPDDPLRRLVTALNDLELMATIGHTDPRTTKTVYGHLFPDSGATIPAKLDAYLEPKPNS